MCSYIYKMKSSSDNIKYLLDEKLLIYNTSNFIADDPICIPHKYTKKQDIEISGFFAATIAWGNRTSIINSANRLMHIMDNAPYDFILHHTDNDLKKCLGFVHRTFNATDLLYFIEVLHHNYVKHDSLEDAFVPDDTYIYEDVGNALRTFYNNFFAGEHPERTRKHVATPDRNSACKRLNMYLRWMVRTDNSGVDFGLWKKIKPYQLVCPVDVHVARVSHRIGITDSEKADWKNAIAITEYLRTLDADDPVKYDFSLFSLGAAERLR